VTGPVRVVGVDPSLTSTGIARLTVTPTGDPDRPGIVAGTFTCHLGEPGGDTDTVRQRWHRLDALADRVVDECASALLVAVEAPPYGIQGQRGVIDSAGFRWLLYDRLLSAGRTVVEVNVTAVKIYATGRGNTSGPTKVTKADMVAAVRATYGRVFDIPSGRGAGDVADAVTLAALAARATGLAIDTLPPSHTRALTGARWPTPALA